MIKFRLRDFAHVFKGPGASLVSGMIKKVTKRALDGFGAYCRAVARNSLKKGNAPSLPGQPPASRTRILKNSIRFETDMVRRSVVIGPRKLDIETVKVTDLVPPLLEYGGLTKLLTGGKFRKARYRARPFMGPAFRTSLPELPRIWQKARRG